MDEAVRDQHHDPLILANRSALQGCPPPQLPPSSSPPKHQHIHDKLVVSRKSLHNIPLQLYLLFCELKRSTMPRFLKRIFNDALFRREPDVSDMQRSRRVLVRSSGGMPGEQSNWRLSLFDVQVQDEERRALRDGASVAGSDMHAAERPILAPSHEQIPARKPSRVRRRLSKRHRRPV